MTEPLTGRDRYDHMSTNDYGNDLRLPPYTGGAFADPDSDPGVAFAYWAVSTFEGALRGYAYREISDDAAVFNARIVAGTADLQDWVEWVRSYVGSVLADILAERSASVLDGRATNTALFLDLGDYSRSPGAVRS